MTTEGDFWKAIRKDPGDEVTRKVFADWLEDRGDDRATLLRDGVVKKFGIDFHSSGGALTLDVGDVCAIKRQDSGHHTRTHEDGWTISGTIHEDYYIWVNDFTATHPFLGRVEGNFEDLVLASSEEAFADFYAKHTPMAWDYMDI